MSEFKKGDEVTFNAFYGESIAAKVTGITMDGRYHLEGVNKPLVSITSGRCIRESKDFVEPKEKFEW